MDSSYSSYHNGTQHREQDFQKVAQTIGTSIQKIFQNGENSATTTHPDSLNSCLRQFRQCSGWSTKSGRTKTTPSYEKNCKLTNPISAPHFPINSKSDIRYNTTRNNWWKTPTATSRIWATSRQPPSSPSRDSARYRGRGCRTSSHRRWTCSRRHRKALRRRRRSRSTKQRRKRSENQF